MKKIILSVLACFTMLSVSAQTVTIENLNYTKGQPGSFDVCLKTDADIFIAYALYIYVPEALNFAANKSGEFLAKKIVEDGECITDGNEMVYTWAASTKFPAKAGFKQYVLVAYDRKLKLLHTSEGGSLCKINFLTSDLDVENSPIIIQEFQFARPNGTNEKSSEIISAIINGKKVVN